MQKCITDFEINMKFKKHSLGLLYTNYQGLLFIFNFIFYTNLHHLECLIIFNQLFLNFIIPF